MRALNDINGGMAGLILSVKAFIRVYIVKPVYGLVLNLLYWRTGLPIKIDRNEKIYISPGSYFISTAYDPWFAGVMGEVRQADVVVDVGAYIGAYAIPFAKRVGPTGRVFAIEPNQKSLLELKRNIKLNKVSSTVEVLNLAVGCVNEPIAIVQGFSESYIWTPHRTDGTRPVTVKSCALDELFCGKRVDIIKLDVEGYEGRVLSGARKLLSMKKTSPRFILIEVHPYAWGGYGATWEGILEILDSCGYSVEIPPLPDSYKDRSIKGLCHPWGIYARKK